MKIKRILLLTLKTALFLILAVIMLFCGIIAYNTVNDYRPVQKEKLAVSGMGLYMATEDSVVSLLSWNMGYCGIGREMDFFYDGGSSVRPPEENLQKYLTGALNFLARYDTVDIILLQEVDTDSKRTYYTNEVALIHEFLPYYACVFAKNYDAGFVPLPVFKPLGKVVSGMTTHSKIRPVEAFRYPYYANYSWPESVFFPDRCLILTKYKMPGGKYLTVINTHNSPFDDAAELRETEGCIIKSIMLDEYERGNYVIAGGDWNRNPPGFDLKKMTVAEAKGKAEPAIDKDFLPPGWKWVYNPSVPTNRDAGESYVKGKTKTTIIDYFVISPNLVVVENKTIPTGFEFSDHQPVYIRVKIKPVVAAEDTLHKKVKEV